ncbi:two-component system sensor histidine kinase ResE [Natronobacillus azotifigens]|nr:ATP-binding protein [Natronobacillus azotifigens]
MFWRSVVGKLWFIFSVVIFSLISIISLLLFEFFNQSYIHEAQEKLLETANSVANLLDEYHDQTWVVDVIEQMKDESVFVSVHYDDGGQWVTTDGNDHSDWLTLNDTVMNSLSERAEIMTKIKLENNMEILLSGTPFEHGFVYTYQPMSVTNVPIDQTTGTILLIAMLAIVMMIIFVFFLSHRITAPLIKMREAALELANGEFKTKVPILTHDEIGELAMAFNRMGRQLNYHMNALKQEKELLYSILGSMADGVMTINRDGKVIISNPQAEKFLKDCQFELETKKENILPSELESFMQEAMETEIEQSRELYIQGRNWVIIMSPLYDQTKVRGVVVVIRDMTKERKMDQLREAFIANVSHELRTPISLLQGYSEAIIDDVASSKEEKNELAQIILDESLRMGRLVNDLLDLARMKAGQMQLNRTIIDLELFIPRILRKFSGVAESKKISLDHQIDPTISTVNVDPDRLEQVFIILIDNAIRHTEEQGEIKISAEKSDEYAQFSVQDNGTGIPQADLPFIFERFYKADKSRTRLAANKMGTGLGLAIAKQIIEAHGGWIDVQSRENEGTMFTFQLPLDINRI